jgi:uncharacterized phage infection (PIP) family protein YhgE
LDSILDNIRKVDTLAAEVAAASGEQSQGIAQVNTAVAEVDKVTQMNAAGSEENASAAEELNTLASSLQEAARELQAVIGVQGSTTRHEAPEPSDSRVAPLIVPVETSTPAPARLAAESVRRPQRPAVAGSVDQGFADF